MFSLNEDFLKSLIQDKNPDYGEITVAEFRIEPVDLRGESYFSNIQRLCVVFRKNSNCTKECKKTLIVKKLPNTVLASFLMDAMQKEIFMYKNISPIMDKLLDASILPCCYYACNDNTLILEDLLQSGYKLSDRIQQLDHSHCVASLEALAMFHAASILINEQNPEYIKIVGKETYYVRENATGKPFTINGFRLLADEIKLSAELAYLSQKLCTFGMQAWDKMIDAISQEYRVSVLNHGDFWSSNIMFLYDSNRTIKNVKLIDLQFCRWSTPAFDLHMFFNTSVRDLNSVKVLTEIYRIKFNTLLSQMGSSVYLTKEQLNADLEMTNCYGLIAAVSLLPICVCDRSDPLDFQQTTNNDFENNFINHNPYEKLYRNKKYKTLITGILNTYECKGVL